jgi:putative DNA methylase
MNAAKKKLIEVALPLEAINAASAREKSIRHGHPSTLHLWWARRPLAACRAVLFAQLVDDPSAHPDRFPTEEDQDRERQRLFRIIEELVKWENSTNERVLELARAEIGKSCTNEHGEVELPPVYDPFSGGGSIPLEAQRLGLPAYGSDLNPVAVMIGKALVEIPPKFAGQPPVNPVSQAKIRESGVWNGKGAQGLAEDVRYYGQWMRDEAFKRIGHLYPTVTLPSPAGGRGAGDEGGKEATVIAWLWARTVASPNPACNGAQVPLASSFALSTKKGKETIVVPVVDAASNSYRFTIKSQGVNAVELAEAKTGTKTGRGANFTCLISGTPITPDYIKAEGKAGRMGAKLMAIVAERVRGRIYLPPTEAMERVAASAEPEWVPEQELPDNPRWFSPPDYGMPIYGDLFTPRQLVALTTFSDFVQEARERVLADARAAGINAKEYPDSIAVYLALAIGRSVDRGSTICSWDSSPKMEALRNTFSRQAIPMTWDYAEGNPFSDSSGNWLNNIEWTAKAIDNLRSNKEGHIEQGDAASIDYGPNYLICSDPPYYDNIGYSDLSDFFYVWLRRSLRRIFPGVFATMLVPKEQELVATPYRHGGKDDAERFFLNGMENAVARMARQAPPDLPATIYYAFKQSEVAQEGIASTGWAIFLEAVGKSGFSVVGTWPMRTEMSNRQIASGTNALASSIVLVSLAINNARK